MSDQAFPPYEELVERARQEFVRRQKRAEVFGKSMFGEPAWDMLLALFVTHTFGARQTVTSLISYVGYPSTTVLRWLGYLEAHRLVTRVQHPTDNRQMFLVLTPKARELLKLYFSDTAEC